MPWHRPVIRESDGDAVILLHGLWRSIWAMEPMADFLNRHGYHTINVPYPSFRKSLSDLTYYIEQVIEEHAKGKKVHFVTHSLGGILTRNLLEKLPPEHTGRVVMLAPPNNGSEIVDWLERCPPLCATLGPAGKDLSTDRISAPPIPDHTDTAVIMGKRSTIPFFRTFLDEQNDGIVSVERGKVDGMNEFHVIDTDHTFIATDLRVMNMTQQFLCDGCTQ